MRPTVAAPALGARHGLHAALIERLGAAIMNGEIAPGHTVSPGEVSRTEQASRTVVREAFRSLEAKGLLHARPNTGTRVTGPQQWYWLDPDVVRWAMSTTRADQVVRLRSALDTLAEQLADNDFYHFAMRVTGAAGPNQQ